MGWTGGFSGKKEAIADARRSITFSGARRLHAEKSTAQAYYAVVDGETPATRILWVTIFEGSGKNICTKTDSECVGFYNALDCPLSFFELVPPDGEFAQQWRDKVRAYHALRATQRGKVRYIKVGAQLAGEIVAVQLCVPTGRSKRAIATGQLAQLRSVGGELVNLGEHYK